MKKFKILEEGRFLTNEEQEKIKGGVVGPQPCTQANGNASCGSTKYSHCEPVSMFTVIACTLLSICGPSGTYYGCNDSKYLVVCGIGQTFTVVPQPPLG